MLATRERLVDAARHLFWERGYAATGLAEILALADANSGSFYHFFDSKDALLRTILETYVEVLDPHVLAPARAEATDPMARVFVLLDSYRQRLVDTDCRYGCPIGRLALEIDPENTPGARTDRQELHRLERRGGHALRRPGARPAEVAAFVLTVMEGGVDAGRARIGRDRALRHLRPPAAPAARRADPHVILRRCPRGGHPEAAHADDRRLGLALAFVVAQVHSCHCSEDHAPQRPPPQGRVPGSLDEVWLAMSTRRMNLALERRPGGHAPRR